MKKILIVDDDPGIARALLRILGRDGHQVVWADGMATAKTLIAGGWADADLVLSDVMMPDGTGADLHRWTAEHHPALARRFTFLTGGFSRRVADYIEASGIRVIEKPFDLMDILDLVGGTPLRARA